MWIILFLLGRGAWNSSSRTDIFWQRLTFKCLQWTRSFTLWCSNSVSTINKEHRNPWIRNWSSGGHSSRMQSLKSMRAFLAQLTEALFTMKKHFISRSCADNVCQLSWKQSNNSVFSVLYDHICPTEDSGDDTIWVTILTAIKILKSNYRKKDEWVYDSSTTGITELYNSHCLSVNRMTCTQREPYFSSGVRVKMYQKYISCSELQGEGWPSYGEWQTGSQLWLRCFDFWCYPKAL